MDVFDAAEKGESSLLRRLVRKRGVDVRRTSDGSTPLHVSSMSGYIKVVDVLLREGASEGNTPLHAAAAEGMLKVMKKLVAHADADQSLRSLNGWTALHMATFHGHIECVKVLLHSKNMNPEIIDLLLPDGSSALHLAASSGFADIVSLLVRNGADVSLKNSKGWNVIHCAAASGKTSVISVLIESNSAVQVDMNCKTEHGDTPLHLSASGGHFEAFSLISKSEGVLIDEKNMFGETPMHGAARNGDLPMLKELILLGADMHVRDSNGITPLDRGKMFSREMYEAERERTNIESQRAETEAESEPVPLTCDIKFPLMPLCPPGPFTFALTMDSVRVRVHSKDSDEVLPVRNHSFQWKPRKYGSYTVELVSKEDIVFGDGEPLNVDVIEPPWNPSVAVDQHIFLFLQSVDSLGCAISNAVSHPSVTVTSDPRVHTELSVRDGHYILDVMSHECGIVKLSVKFGDVVESVYYVEFFE